MHIFVFTSPFPVFKTIRVEFYAYILSFKSASVHERERVSLTDSEIPGLLRYVREHLRYTACLVLSTCNRLEIYVRHTEEPFADLALALSSCKNIPLSDLPHFECLSGKPAIEHIFRVSAGLNSQVPGDTHLVAQVRAAYQTSIEFELVDAFIHKVIQFCLQANKRISTETEFRSGSASIPYITTKLIRKLAKHTPDASVLVLGAGEMGRDIALHLAKSQAFPVTLSNRTREKAEIISQKTHFPVLNWEEWPNHFQSFNIIVSTVAVPQPIVTEEMQHNSPIPRIYIDLSMPRSIDAKLQHSQNVDMYNIDDLSQHSDATLQRRLADIPKVEAILTESIQQFIAWSEELAFTQYLKDIKATLLEISNREIKRFGTEVNAENKHLLQQFSESLVEKILRRPTVAIKNVGDTQEQIYRAEILRQFFQS